LAKGTILVVEDDDIARQNLQYILEKEGYDVLAAETGVKALQLLEKSEFDLVLTDLKMQQVDGMQVLNMVRENHPHTEVIMITAYATVDTAVEAMRQGAYHYIPKPYKVDLVRKLVREALYKRNLYLENIQLKTELAEHKGKKRPLLIGASQPMRQVIELIEHVAPTDSNVLIIGETGTGKELAAKTLHALSNRSTENFLAVNCGAFSEELLVNELFGHEKEAFTGAATKKIGLIEAADQGTLFLDEIGEMPANMQVMLLRVMEEKELLRVGGTAPVPVNVRFIAATSRDLKRECEAGRFRLDLFYRLNVVNLYLPPLVERADDIPLLINYFLDTKTKQVNKEVTEVEPEAMELLKNYSWPGNVRELENVMERAVVMTRTPTIKVNDLPPDILDLSVQTFRLKNDGPPSMEEQEIEYIKWVLNHVGWNKTKAAEIMKIDRASLWRKLKRYGIE
jgi:DNA-binding NtrC family response regulator